MSSKTSTKSSNKLPKWDAVIRETEVEILKSKERLAGLRSALRVFKERKESGEPFPGEEAKQEKDLEK